MNKKRFLISVCVLFIAFSGTLFAQEYTVEYVDGFAEGRLSGEWIDLYIGDYLEAGDALRLEGGAVVELSGGKSTLTLTKPGTYYIDELFKQAQKRENVGFDSLVASKLDSLFGGSDKSLVPTAVGGVRGDAVGGGDDFGWIESEVDELIDSGAGALEQGEYERALDLFMEAYDYSLDDEEENKSLFYLGYTYNVLNQPGKALDYLDDISAGSESEIYADWYLLKGKILIETFDYESAVDFLGNFNDGSALKEDKQVIYFLLGIAHDSLENSYQASEYYQKAYEAEQESEIGKAARSLLEG
jgi:tetratricopeptide (TPR) repeat protein